MLADTEPMTVDHLRVLPYGQRRELVDGVLVVGDGDGLTRETLRYLRRLDGRRYELLDGLVVVSPAPDDRARRVAAAFAEAFLAAGLTAREAPCLVVDERTETQPAVLAERDGVPVVVVEVMSPHTKAFDLLPKRERYERAGLPGYWVADPDEGVLRCWRLRGGSYGDPVTYAAPCRGSPAPPG